MKELFATYVLKNDKNETLAEFESNVSPGYILINKN
jgi:hypothetical protein